VPEPAAAAAAAAAVVSGEAGAGAGSGGGGVQGGVASGRINGSSSSNCADLEVAVISVSITASTCWFGFFVSTVSDRPLAAGHFDCHGSCTLLWRHVWLLIANC
jgi:hypothetical protein